MGDKRNEQPMFELHDCEDIFLENNSTSQSKLLAAEHTKRIHAKQNTAGLVERPMEKRNDHTVVLAALKWVGGVGTTLLVAYIAYLAGWN